MQIVIDESLLKRAQKLSGLSDYKAVVEEALRVLIEKRQQINDVAGYLRTSDYAAFPRQKRHRQSACPGRYLGGMRVCMIESLCRFVLSR